MKDKVNKKDIQPWIKDIIWRARRYADGRQTYAPDMFNKAYDALREHFTEDELDKQVDGNVKSYPYASDEPNL